MFEAAATGHLISQYLVLFYYTPHDQINGINVKKIKTELSADSTTIANKFHLAFCLITSPLNNSESEQGHALLKECCEAGYARAQAVMGIVYFKGISNIKKNLEEAKKYLSAAIANRDFLAAMYVSIFGSSGNLNITIPEDLTAEIEFLSPIQGYKASLLMKNLANDSKEKELELNDLRVHLNIACEEHDPMALCNAGWQYLQGVGVSRNIPHAKELLELSAYYNFYPAYFFLGMIHEELEQTDLARNCYHLAAQQGYRKND